MRTYDLWDYCTFSAFSLSDLGDTPEYRTLWSAEYDRLEEDSDFEGEGDLSPGS